MKGSVRTGTDSAPQAPAHWQEGFLSGHGLGPEYLAVAQLWFDPLVQSLHLHQKSAEPYLLLGFNGAQGSGKSTLADYLVSALEGEYHLPALTLSLDDFYLTRDERLDLADRVHPLLATRGVPGTHDLPLLFEVLDRLADPAAYPVAIPRFDKARDERRPIAAWDRLTTPPGLVILEGWCLGAGPQDEAELARPVNELEEREDPDRRWRNYVNRALAEGFPSLYQRVDQWLMLSAPSFDCVYTWRLEQERKLAARAPQGDAVMDARQVAAFIQYFQRLTEHCLRTLPPRMDHLYQLDRQRRIVSYRRQQPGAESCRAR